MKTLPSVLVTEKNKLFTSSVWIVLLDIHLNSTIYRFCSNNENVTFDGETYICFPFDLEPFTENSEGEIPSVILRVSNVTQLIHSYLEELDGAVGATVIVRVVNSQYLSENYSELEYTFSILSVSANSEWLTFTLGAENPLRRRFPPYRFIANHCHWDFKSVECGYSGSETVCDRSYERCSVLGNVVRFGGYRGLSDKSWKIA